jgi:hypothetical protein
LAERGCPIAMKKLYRDVSTYTARQRRNNLPHLLVMSSGTITLSGLGRKLVSNQSLEADFLRKLFLNKRFRRKTKK